MSRAKKHAKIVYFVLVYHLLTINISSQETVVVRMSHDLSLEGRDIDAVVVVVVVVAVVVLIMVSQEVSTASRCCSC